MAAPEAVSEHALPSRKRASRAAATRGANPGNAKVVQFGSAAVRSPERSDKWAGNLELSHRAMGEIEASLRKPGVRLRRIEKATPLFRATPADPAQLVRTLDGKEERGVFVGGVFQARNDEPH